MTNKHPYIIAANEDFFKSLKQLIITKFDLNCKLKDVTILLPTKFSCFTLKEEFLKEKLPLPKIYPINDLSDLVKLSAPYLERMALLNKITKIIISMDLDNFKKISAITELAEYLADFLYKAESYQVNLENFLEIINLDLSLHKQELLDILAKFIKIWKQNYSLTKAGYNNLLIEEFSKNLNNKHLIIAGINSNLPCITNLIAKAANSDNSNIVLYGLDERLSQYDWENIDITHPQYNFKNLFKLLNIKPFLIINPTSTRHPWQAAIGSADRGSQEFILTRSPTSDFVLVRDDAENDIKPQSKYFIDDELISNALKPAKSCNNWHNLKIKDDHISYINCSDPHNEAQTIIALIKKNPDKKTLIITQDDDLMVKIMHHLQVNQINANIIRDHPLKQTKTGTWLDLCLNFILNKYSLISGLALLKHPFAAISEETLLQLESLLRDKNFKSNNIFDANIEDEFLIKLKESSINFEKFSSFKNFLSAHIKFAEEFSLGDIWDGDELKKHLDQILEHYNAIERISLSDYLSVFNHLLKSAYFRYPITIDSLVTLAKPIDARLHNSDLVILAGLNEGIWPKKTNIDPCFNNNLLAKIGLPQLEQSIGEEAYDFQCFSSAKEVILTRSERIDGVVTIPSRWLLRIITLSGKKATHFSLEKNINDSLLNNSGSATPPLEYRPTKLSVTQIDKLISNPYHIYVDLILGLKKTNPLIKELSALDFGNFVHKALEIYHNFSHVIPDEDKVRDRGSQEIILTRSPVCNAYGSLPGMTKNGIECITLLEAGEAALNELRIYNPQIKLLWWPRFIRIANWFKINEDKSVKAYLEDSGMMKIGLSFVINAKADRIELSNNFVNIIDYKTGKLASAKSIYSGKTLQLLLEALIASNGGFHCQAKKPYQINTLKYIQLSGGEEPAQILEIDLQKPILEETKSYIDKLIAEYQNPQTPYYYTKKKLLGYCPYSHLSRSFD